MDTASGRLERSRVVGEPHAAELVLVAAGVVDHEPGRGLGVGRAVVKRAEVQRTDVEAEVQVLRDDRHFARPNEQYRITERRHAPEMCIVSSIW